jgi:DNA-directed RNA polymerase specialized sigma24 family protein
MPETPESPFLKDLARDQLENLAGLYDRYANALDPRSHDSVIAEKFFQDEFLRFYDLYGQGSEFTAFRRAVIKLCRDYLRKEAKQPPTIE